MSTEQSGISFNKETFVQLTAGDVFEKYTKEKLLGTGSYGQVYRVKHNITGDIRACKQLIKSRISDLEKFKVEISIMMKADHPSIIKLYEVYEDNRSIYLIMEECLGGELFGKIIKKIDEGKMFDEGEASHIFLQMMSAVAYCHKKGICHRDLKPENVLYLTESDDSPVKIIDFGLSKIYGGNHKSKTLKRMKTKVGTAYYVSPEVLEGNYDEKCDIWSAGVILFILLTGDPPFNGPNDNAIYRAIIQRKYSFDPNKWGNISEDAKDLIKHMICPPQERYSALQVLDHPWIKNISSIKKGVFTKENADSLRKYRNSPKLKRAVMTFIASRLKDNEIRNLKRVFIDLDANKDGTISIEELRNGISQIEGLNQEDVDEIFKTMDTDNSGNIEITEFIAATMEKNLYLKAERLEEAFKSMDKDKSGKISKKELKNALRVNSKNDDIIGKYIEQFDLDGDGEIDYQEFLSMMESNEMEID